MNANTLIAALQNLIPLNGDVKVINDDGEEVLDVEFNVEGDDHAYVLIFS